MKRQPGKKALLDLDLNHKYLFYRRTKIVATIGPATESEQRLRQLIKSGMNIARINFSHGDPSGHVKLIARIRKIARSLNASVAILADLCGPKVRVGTFKNDSALLKERSVVRITDRDVIGDATLIPSQYKGIVKEACTGDRVLLDDGNLELKIIGKKQGMLEARVVRGGILKNRKGMNLPDTEMKITALTRKDRHDLKYCIDAEVDYIALSFVRTAKDVADLKKILKRSRADIQIIAKIEKPEALDNIETIVRLSDGIMIARGDLGVEMPPQKVPLIQDKLIAITNQHNKPVIVATQMMESMIDHSRPTRAEISDVSGACMAGADAVMLSAETAVGKYPVETVSIMDTVLRETEAYQFHTMGARFKKAGKEQRADLHDIIGITVSQLSRDLLVRCIFVATISGKSIQTMSSNRPAAPIFAVTHSERIRRRLNLLWGVNPILVSKELSPGNYGQLAEDTLKRLQLGKKGDYIILLTGFGWDKCTANSINIHQIS